MMGMPEVTIELGIVLCSNIEAVVGELQQEVVVK